jgi:hypothetical protein
MSLRRAIDAKCRDRIFDPAMPGTWREQVAQCACTDCPLWPHRPAPRVASKHRVKPDGGGKSLPNRTYPHTPATAARHQFSPHNLRPTSSRIECFKKHGIRLKMSSKA